VGKGLGQYTAVFHGLASALAKIGQQGVGGVTEQGCAALRTLLQFGAPARPGFGSDESGQRRVVREPEVPALDQLQPTTRVLRGEVAGERMGTCVQADSSSFVALRSPAISEAIRTIPRINFTMARFHCYSHPA
jgi:hypothetical protein